MVIRQRTRATANAIIIEHDPGNRQFMAHGNLHFKAVEAKSGKGYHVETPEAFRAALRESFDGGETTLINVMIDPVAKRRPQQFAWLTR